MNQNDMDRIIAERAAARVTAGPARVTSLPAAATTVQMPSSKPHARFFGFLVANAMENNEVGFVKGKRTITSPNAGKKAIGIALRNAEIEDTTFGSDIPWYDLLDDLVAAGYVTEIINRVSGRITYCPTFMHSDAPTVRGARSSKGQKSSDFARRLDARLDSLTFVTEPAATGTDGK